MIKQVCTVIILCLSAAARAQETPFLQTGSNISSRNPAFTGITVKPRASLHYKWQGYKRPPGIKRNSLVNYGLGYEQGLGNKPGFAGINLALDDRDWTTGYTQTRTASIQYALEELGENGCFRFGARAGLLNQKIYRITSAAGEIRDHTNPQFHLGLGTALVLRKFYLGLSYQNINHPQAKTRKNGLSYETPILFNFNTGAFLPLSKKDNVIAVPSVEFIGSMDGWWNGIDEARAAIRLEMLTDHFTWGAGFNLSAGDGNMEMTFGYVAERFRAGYTYSNRIFMLGSTVSNLAHEVGIAWFPGQAGEEVKRSTAYYFRRMF